jgi:phosphoglycerol transferase MdoB-like AlkP superfamily enzyme
MKNIKNIFDGICQKFQSLLFSFFILTMMGLCLGLISLYFGAGYYKLPMFLSYFKVDYLPVLNIFPVLLCLFLLYFIFNRVWASFLLTSIFTIGLSWVNYFKLMIRNDPLLAADVSLFSEAKNMAGKYEINPDWKIYAVVIACIIGTVLAKVLFRGKIQTIKYRLIGIVVLFTLIITSYNFIFTNGKIYAATENLGLINQWSSTQVYISKGFLYPFIFSIQSSKEKKPDGYNEKEAKERIRSYGYSNIDENKKVNVIGIMLESYNDFSKFVQVKMNKEVYEAFHQLKAESYSGELTPNIFGGGTVDTERAFLTGLTTDKNFRRNVNSYVRYFKEQGYTVEGSHPVYDWFYNRKNVNEYMGFENYYFFENLYSDLADGQIANDNILFPQIIKLYEENKKTGKPYFSFNVTYQNHGPYPTGGTWEKQFVFNKGLSREEYNLLNNYFAGIYSTNLELMALTDYFRNEGEPVILILFGDHNPGLGDNNIVYQKLGINLDSGTEKGFYDHFNTPYLIWGNDNAKEILGNDLNGEGPTISPYFLMNEFFNLAGYGGNEFMKLSNELRAELAVVHSSGRYKQSGKLTAELSSENQQKLNDFLKTQYYWKNNFKK